ncbi:hypothetical protein Tco_0610192 [Tanacetum coccineum]
MSGNDDFSLHDDEELSLHDDASLAGSIMDSENDSNGNSKKRVTKRKDVYKVLPPTTKEEQFADEIERKERTLTVNGCSKRSSQNSDVFHAMDVCQRDWAAIKTRVSVESVEKEEMILFQKRHITVGCPWCWCLMKTQIHKFMRHPTRTSSSSLTSDNVAFLYKQKASSSKHKSQVRESSEVMRSIEEQTEDEELNQALMAFHSEIMRKAAFNSLMQAVNKLESSA